MSGGTQRKRTRRAAPQTSSYQRHVVVDERLGLVQLALGARRDGGVAPGVLWLVPAKAKAPHGGGERRRRRRPAAVGAAWPQPAVRQREIRAEEGVVAVGATSAPLPSLSGGGARGGGGGAGKERSVPAGRSSGGRDRQEPVAEEVGIGAAAADRHEMQRVD